LRVGALIACVAGDTERSMVESALSYSCRGTWSNCNRGGLAAIARLIVDPEMARACALDRERAKGLLRARVDAFNARAGARGLKHPRYEGGFFVTVFADRPHDRADAMRAQGVYVLPQLPASPTVPSGMTAGAPRGALRIALCSVATADVPRLVDVLAEVLAVPA
jgi:aromatic-amino-acid transaminase